MGMPLPVPDWMIEALKIGGSVGAGGVGLRCLDALLGRRKDAATTRNLDAETTKTLGKVIDDHMRLLLDSMTSQIEWQQEQINRLTKQVADQAGHIQRQDEEIVALRKALDERPRAPPMLGI